MTLSLPPPPPPPPGERRKENAHRLRRNGDSNSSSLSSTKSDGIDRHSHSGPEYYDIVSETVRRTLALVEAAEAVSLANARKGGGKECLSTVRRTLALAEAARTGRGRRDRTNSNNNINTNTNMNMNKNPPKHEEPFRAAPRRIGSGASDFPDDGRSRSISRGRSRARSRGGDSGRDKSRNKSRDDERRSQPSQPSQPSSRLVSSVRHSPVTGRKQRRPAGDYTTRRGPCPRSADTARSPSRPRATTPARSKSRDRSDNNGRGWSGERRPGNSNNNYGHRRDQNRDYDDNDERRNTRARSRSRTERRTRSRSRPRSLSRDPKSVIRPQSRTSRSASFEESGSLLGIDLVVDPSTGFGAFDHPDVPSLSFMVKDGKGTFSHPQNLKVVFIITLDTSADNPSYKIMCSMDRLSKIRKKLPKTNVLGSLSHWNNVQENRPGHRGLLAIDRKNSANKKRWEVVITISGRLSLGKYCGDSRGSCDKDEDYASEGGTKRWKLGSSFQNNFEWFVDDAFNFYSILHGSSLAQ